MKRRSFIRQLATTAALSLIAFSPLYADVLESIEKDGVLTVAVPQDFPPFGSVGTDLKPVGYDIDMAKLIADDLGVMV